MADDKNEAVKAFIEHERTLSYIQRCERMEEIKAQGLDPHNIDHRHEHHKALVARDKGQDDAE